MQANWLRYARKTGVKRKERAAQNHLGIHPGAHLINPQWAVRPQHKGPPHLQTRLPTSSSPSPSSPFETRHLRVPSSCLFVFMTQSQPRAQLATQAPILGISSHLPGSKIPPIARPLARLLPSALDLWVHERIVKPKSLGPRNRRPPSVPTEVGSIVPQPYS